MLNTDEYGLELAKAAAEGAGRESVNKLANLIGGIFPFFGIKRDAIETYVSEIQCSNLSPEAKMFAISNAKKTYKQLKNQAAIAQIAQEAAADGTDFSNTSEVDDEWLERFMDSAKFVSDEEVQLLWGNILASEFEQPGNTPPSVIRILSEITPFYAKAFQALCSFSVSMAVEYQNGDILPIRDRIILPPDFDHLSKYTLSFKTLSELESLGMIRLNTLTGYVLPYETKNIPKLHISYNNNTATVINYPDKKFPIGCVDLTDAGHSIARFTNPQLMGTHFDTIIKYLVQKQVTIADMPKIHVKITNQQSQ